MALFKVSKKAEGDLLEIGRYTQTEWGINQRDKYLDEINRRFHQDAASLSLIFSSCRASIRRGFGQFRGGASLQ